MRAKCSYLFLIVFSCVLLPLAGCSGSQTPSGPEKGSVQRYLDENPEAAARIDQEPETDE